MILDAAAGQILSANQAITVTAASSNVFDTAGVGVGQPAPNIFGKPTFGANTSFGQDLGGGGPNNAGAPQLGVFVTTTFTAGGAGTLRIELQAAEDTSPNTGTPGTWRTILQTDDYPLSALTTNTALQSFTVPDRYPGQGFPRFYRLNYVVTTGPMLTGAISAYLATGFDDAVRQIYPANY